MFDDLDAFVNRCLDTFHTPGMAIGVVKNEEVLLSKGYGFADVAQKRKVMENTVFALAFSTKPFTSFLLAKLVDRGLLAWEDPVIKHIPEFQFANKDVSDQWTIRDLLSHRSGMPRHDMVWYNAPISRSDLLKN